MRTTSNRSPRRRPDAKATQPSIISRELRDLVSHLATLHHDALKAYTPLVDQTIADGSRNVKEIEHLLDGILDFCGDEKMLTIFKRLCRHYYGIDPRATAEYVHLYRKMWDEGKPPAVKGARRARKPAVRR
jgi:hypothetical protein